MFTAGEMRSIKKLEDHLRYWRFTRYILLVLGLAIFFGSMYINYDRTKTLVDLTRDMSFNESLTGLEVFLACLNTVMISVSYFLKIAGLWMTIFVLGRWSGDPTTKLLVAIARRTGPEGAG